MSDVTAHNVICLCHVYVVLEIVTYYIYVIYLTQNGNKLTDGNVWFVFVFILFFR